jgi:hypothetical protein
MGWLLWVFGSLGYCVFFWVYGGYDDGDGSFDLGDGVTFGKKSGGCCVGSCAETVSI